MPSKKNIVMDRERFEMLSSLFFELNGEIVTFSRKKSDKVLIQTSKSEMVSNSEIIKYEECPERWFNLVAYCFCLFANGFQWFSFSQISNHFSIHYSISLWKIQLLSMIYFIIYPFVFIPEALLMEKYNLKIGLLLPSLFTLVGSFFKIFTR